MSRDISLYNLVDLSIGTPEIGAVNFKALHTLLHAILDHLKIQNVSIKWTREEEDCVGQTMMTAPPTENNRSAPRYQDLEDKLRRIETQIALVENLPSVTELLDRSSAPATPVRDMWQLMQLRSKIQTNEDGVSKAWLAEIHEYAQQDVVLMLLGNKADSTHERVVKKEDGERLAKEFGVPFMETSARSGLNVELAFTALAKELRHRATKDPDDQFKLHDYVNKEVKGASCCRS